MSSIQGEARRESLGAPEKEVKRKQSRWESGCWSASDDKPGLVGRVDGCGALRALGQGECRPSGEPRPCSYREHEEEAGEAHAEAALSVEGRAAPFPAWTASFLTFSG